MQSLVSILEQAFADIPLSDEDKNAMVGAYMVQYYRSSLEAILGIRATDAAFIDKLNAFFETSVKEMTPEEQTQFTTLLDQEQPKIVGQIIASVAQNLPPEMKENVTRTLETHAIRNILAGK